MNDYSVRQHLRLEVAEYDEAIRKFLPAYERMIDHAASLAVANHPRHVLELGTGTGALAEAILDRSDQCRVSLIDADSEMLDQARARLGDRSSRARFLHRAFQGSLPNCDSVAASLALHHVPTLEEKARVYREIHAALEPGGVFVNADVTMPSEPDARQADYEVWVKHLVGAGIPEPRAWAHFDEWSAEDFYFPVDEELAALRAAGFDVQLLWRVTPSTLIRARKPVRSG